MARSEFNTFDTVEYIWQQLALPREALQSCNLEEAGHILPSSFKIGHLGQASIALSGLAAALVDSHHNKTSVRNISGSAQHAAVEFASERLYSVNGQPASSSWGPIGGLHKTKDGYVRMHDSFINHRLAALKILGLRGDASKEEVARKILEWKALELEKEAMKNKAVIYALRSYEEWDVLPQAQAVPEFPISIRKISDEGSSGVPKHMPLKADKCLRGLRVLEFSRVIAAPVAGKTLAAHGADVLWITSPNLPSLSTLDIDVSRGKRTIQLDLNETRDVETLKHLVKDADVFLQSYRPGSFSARGFGPIELARTRPGIICANLSAWGNEGLWSENRGFDSIVQTVSGMNVSEAKHFDPSNSTPAKAMPVQALDHAAGYLLATGISAAVYKRALEGGSWEVNVSLADVMKYSRSLGQLNGRDGFEGDVAMPEQLVAEEMLEERDCNFGALKAVRHSVTVEGKTVGWDVMPKELGGDEAEWL
ncbi:-transferase family III [Lecanosticta acicola]|uniref:-transferase family III n=1 Tax=Lecanosticta acicola TaxID=111012 RepID=A0AAI8W190_9PEZI|nr:-transferase family III [Lecanosticta acicola]